MHQEGRQVALGRGLPQNILCDRRSLREIFPVPASDQIRNKLSQLPHKTGVYLMKDRFGTVIYVGKARSLRKRVSQYFHPSRRQGWDLKLSALVEAIHDFDVHVVRNEPEAVLLEGKLIKSSSSINVGFRDDKRFLLLKVNPNDRSSLPLTRLKQDDGARYSTVRQLRALRRTLIMVRRKFNLRDAGHSRPKRTTTLPLRQLNTARPRALARDPRASAGAGGG